MSAVVSLCSAQHAQAFRNSRFQASCIHGITATVRRSPSDGFARQHCACCTVGGQCRNVYILACRRQAHQEIRFLSAAAVARDSSVSEPVSACIVQMFIHSFPQMLHHVLGGCRGASHLIGEPNITPIALTCPSGVGRIKDSLEMPSQTIRNMVRPHPVLRDGTELQKSSSIGLLRHAAYN